MKTMDNKLSVASTSALVLTIVKNMYTSCLSQEYLSHIDLSNVEKLAEEMQAISPLFKDVLYYRKRMVRRFIQDFLFRYPRQQLCILAAGLDPLALQIAETFPDQFTGIYEADSAHMQEKEELYSRIAFKDRRLHTIHADITNTTVLMQALLAAGYDPDQPTLIVFEGIIHYLTEEEFLPVMRSFCSRMRNNAVILDYTLPSEDLQPEFLHRANTMIELLEDYIGFRAKQYSRKKILNLLSLLEAELVDVYDLQAIEYALNGQNKHYHRIGEGMMEMVSFYI